MLECSNVSATEGAIMITETAHDPVCHMDIDRNSAAGTSEYEGTTYYFCSRGCKHDFDEDPAAVLAAEAQHDHSQPMEPMMMMDEPAAAKKPWWKFWA
jgi:Cu+-exporting ATPase